MPSRGATAIGGPSTDGVCASRLDITRRNHYLKSKLDSPRAWPPCVECIARENANP